MLQLSERDDAMSRGAFGDGVARAMRIVTRTAEVMSAPHLIDITSAHIDGCLYHGRTSLTSSSISSTPARASRCRPR